MRPVSTVLFLILIFAAVVYAHERIRERDIQVITVRKGHMTTHRRVGAYPQIVCSGPHCGSAPDVIQCVNKGWSGSSVQWACEAQMASDLHFGPMKITCEGWDGPGDPYVLAGSCSLEYELKRDPPPAPPAHHYTPPSHYIRRDRRHDTQSGEAIIAVGICLLPIIAVAALVWACSTYKLDADFVDDVAEPVHVARVMHGPVLRPRDPVTGGVVHHIHHDLSPPPSYHVHHAPPVYHSAPPAVVSSSSSDSDWWPSSAWSSSPSPAPVKTETKTGYASSGSSRGSSSFWGGSSGSSWGGSSGSSGSSGGSSWGGSSGSSGGSSTKTGFGSSSSSR